MNKVKFATKAKAITLMSIFFVTVILLQEFPFIRSKYVPSEILNHFYNVLPISMFDILVFILNVILAYLVTRVLGSKVLSDSLNPNDTIYINDNINWVYIAYFFGGVRDFELKNVPIWMSFKLMLRWPRLNGVANKPDEDNSEIQCDKVNFGKDQTEINIVISDTYDVSSKVLRSDEENIETWHFMKVGLSGSYKSYNSKLLRAVSSKIAEFSKSYTTINLFLGTSPYMTKMIIETCFEMDGRDGFEHLNVYEASSKQNFRFTKKHKIY